MNSFDKIIQEEYQKILQEQRDTIEISKISPRKTAKMKSIYPDMIDVFKVIAKAPGKSLSRNIVQRNLANMPELQGWKTASNKYLFIIGDDSFKGKNDKESRIVVIKRLNDEDLKRSGLIPYGSKSYFIFQDDFEKDIPTKELETIVAQSAENEKLKQTNVAQSVINNRQAKQIKQLQKQLDQQAKELKAATNVAEKDQEEKIEIPKVTLGTNPKQLGEHPMGGLTQTWGNTVGILNGLIDSVKSKFPNVKVSSKKREDQLTLAGRRSDHWTGSLDSSAVDFSVPKVPTGEKSIGNTLGDQIFTSILDALGEQAPKTGGIKNVTKNGLRYQVIWRTTQHYDHVHVGIRNKNLNWNPSETSDVEADEFTFRG